MPEEYMEDNSAERLSNSSTILQDKNVVHSTSDAEHDLPEKHPYVMDDNKEESPSTNLPHALQDCSKDCRSFSTSLLDTSGVSSLPSVTIEAEIRTATRATSSLVDFTDPSISENARSNSMILLCEESSNQETDLLLMSNSEAEISVASNPDTEECSVASNPDTEECSVAFNPDTEEFLLASNPDTEEFLLASNPGTEEFLLACNPGTEEFSMTSNPDAEEFLLASNPDTEEFLVTSNLDTEEFPVTSNPDTREFPGTSNPDTKEFPGTSNPDTKEFPVTSNPDTEEFLVTCNTRAEEFTMGSYSEAESVAVPNTEAEFTISTPETEKYSVTSKPATESQFTTSLNHKTQQLALIPNSEAEFALKSSHEKEFTSISNPETEFEVTSNHEIDFAATSSPTTELPVAEFIATPNTETGFAPTFDSEVDDVIFLQAENKNASSIDKCEIQLDLTNRSVSIDEACHLSSLDKAIENGEFSKSENSLKVEELQLEISPSALLGEGSSKTPASSTSEIDFSVDTFVSNFEEYPNVTNSNIDPQSLDDVAGNSNVIKSICDNPPTGTDNRSNSPIEESTATEVPSDGCSNDGSCNQAVNGNVISKDSAVCCEKASIDCVDLLLDVSGNCASEVLVQEKTKIECDVADKTSDVAGKTKKGKKKTVKKKSSTVASQSDSKDEISRGSNNQSADANSDLKINKPKNKGKKNKFDSKEDSTANLASPSNTRKILIRGQKWRADVNKFKCDHPDTTILPTNQSVSEEDCLNTSIKDSNTDPIREPVSVANSNDVQTVTHESETNDRTSVTLKEVTDATVAVSELQVTLLDQPQLDILINADSVEDSNSSAAVESASLQIVNDTNENFANDKVESSDISNDEDDQISPLAFLPLEKNRTIMLSKEKVPDSEIFTLDNGIPISVRISEAPEIEQAEREYLSSTSDSTEQDKRTSVEHDILDDNDNEEYQKQDSNKYSEEQMFEANDSVALLDVTKDSIDSNEDFKHYVINNGIFDNSATNETLTDKASPASPGNNIESNCSSKHKSEHICSTGTFDITYIPPIYKDASVDSFSDKHNHQLKENARETLFNETCHCRPDLNEDDIVVPQLFESDDSCESLDDFPQSRDSTSPRFVRGSSDGQGSCEQSHSTSSDVSSPLTDDEHIRSITRHSSIGSTLSQASTMAEHSSTPVSQLVGEQRCLPTSGKHVSALSLPHARKMSRKKLNSRRLEKRIERKNTTLITLGGDFDIQATSSGGQCSDNDDSSKEPYLLGSNATDIGISCANLGECDSAKIDVQHRKSKDIQNDLLLQKVSNINLSDSGDCSASSGLVQRWENVQQKAAHRQQQSRQLQQIHNNLKQVHLKLDALQQHYTCQTNEARIADIHSLQQLQDRLTVAQARQAHLTEVQAELSELNLSIHKHSTDTGHQLPSLQPQLHHLYQLADTLSHQISCEVSQLSAACKALESWQEQADELKQCLQQDDETLNKLQRAVSGGPEDIDKLQINEPNAEQCSLSSTTKGLVRILTQQQNGSSPRSSNSGSSNACLSDSGTSGYESCSSDDLSERERRLDALKRLASELENTLHPHSLAWTNIKKTISNAEVELSSLQKRCRELLIKTAEKVAPAGNNLCTRVSRRRAAGNQLRINKASRGSPTRRNRSSSRGRMVPGTPRNGWLWRVVRIALPIQAALLLLFCVSCLLEPSCCDSLNTLNFDLGLQVRYIHGKPPV